MTSRDDAQMTAAALHAAISLFTRRVRETKSSELSLPEKTTLSRLDRKGPSTTADLARWEEISPQAVGVTVSALEARGYLSRSRDPDDGRRSILTITDAGTAAVHANRSALTERMTAALDEQFTADELDLIRRAVPAIQRLADLI